jgi:hypothetical protein
MDGILLGLQLVFTDGNPVSQTKGDVMKSSFLKTALLAFLCFYLPSVTHGNEAFECSINKFHKWRLQKASPEIEDLLDRIVTIGGVKQKYNICVTPNIANAGAAIHWDTAKKIIIYDPVFLNKWADLSGELYWGVVTILAHEVGHHVLGHTARANLNATLEKKRSNELEADRFAGYVLGKLGASLDNTLALMKKMDVKINDSKHSHPNGGKRIVSIKTGWLKACEDSGSDCNNPLMKLAKKPSGSAPNRSSTAYKTSGYPEFEKLSVHFKGRKITKDFCETYADISVQQAFAAKRLNCGFNIDRSQNNSQWSVHWNPQFNWCMKYSAHASSREINFREEKLKTCVSGPKIFRPKTTVTGFNRSALLQFESAESGISTKSPSSPKNTKAVVSTSNKATPLSKTKASKPLVKPSLQENNTETLGKNRADCLRDDALHKAAAGGNIDFVQSCLKLGVDANVTEGNKWTPLHSASRQGHLDIVKLLHKNNANLNARDAYRRTPLDHAIIGKNSQIANFLKENGGTDRR